MKRARHTPFAAAAFTALALCAGLSLALPQTAHADNIRTPGGIGLGLGSGTVSNGLSGKLFLSDGNALQLVVGTWGGGGYKDRYGNFHGLGLSADYLLEMPAIASGSVVELAWNIGGGVGVGLDDDAFGLAGAFIAGLEFNFVPLPISLVLEYRPTLGVAPGLGFDLIDFTGHLRVHF